MLSLIIAAAIALPQDATKPAATKPALIVPAAAPSKDVIEPQEPLLTPGSPAPFPNISNFIKGDSIAGYLPGKTYVFEFWATWCGPCKAGMPHLSAVQKEYADKGVIIIGISDEKVDTVSAFLAKPEWAEKTQYTLATDPDRSAWNEYMKPALQNGIPCAFIVKNEIVQWIGHPMQMDEPIKEIVDGSWDLAKAKASFEGTAQAKKVQRRMASLMREAKSTGDYTALLAMLDEAIAKASATERAPMEIQKFQLLLAGAKQPEAGYTLGRQLVANFSGTKNAMALNQIAWFVLDTPGIETRNYDFAMEAAVAARDASGGNDGAILDTLARAYWEKGDKANAIATQELAITKTAAGQMLEEMKSTLETYKTTTPKNANAT